MKRHFSLRHFRLPAWGSVRLRMTLWNVGVLAVILAVLGSVVRYAVQSRLYASVDQLLETRSRTMVLRRLHDLPGPGKERRLKLKGTLEPPQLGAEDRILGTAGAPVTQLPGDDLLRADTSPNARPELIPRIIIRGKIVPPETPREEPWDTRAYRRSLAGDTLHSTVQIHGRRLRVFSQPLRSSIRVNGEEVTRGRNEVQGVVQVAFSLEGVEQELERLTATLLMLAPLGLLLAGVGGAWITRRALRPVREMAEEATRMGASDLSRRLPASGRDEFTELAHAFNGLLGRVEEQVERQRRFTADASHELRTPLAIIKANTEQALESEWSPARYRESMAAIDEAAERQRRLVEDLLFLARGDAGHLARDLAPTALLEVLEEARDSLPPAGRPAVHLHVENPDLMVRGSGFELTRLFTNLLENAVRHTPVDGTITLTAGRKGDAVRVTVADTGEGIDPEHLPRLTERFYRADSARTRRDGGSGLGLAICRSIVEAHGGTLRIESELGRGTTVKVELPA